LRKYKRKPIETKQNSIKGVWSTSFMNVCNWAEVWCFIKLNNHTNLKYKKTMTSGKDPNTLT